ncbi:MAG: PPC domain-containing protein, partial [Sedimentisphaerales bacterium]|nr:PPC domain-containing protein [Sedimentisphaerales bacterium]
MKQYRWQTILFAFGILAGSLPIAVFAAGARNARKPGIGYVYPAGGQKGQTLEVKLAGRLLDGISEVAVSGRGVKAELVEYVKPLNGKELNLLRDRLKELQEKVKPQKKNDGKGVAADDAKTSENADGEADIDAMREEMTQIREKLANPKNRNRDNPQLAEDVTLRITVAPDAEPGRRELRLKTNLGLSNPVTFHVGQLPEYSEKEPNNGQPDAAAFSNLPLVLNGQIMPGDVDKFRLNLTKGQKLVMAVSARELTPYLADAVPGWFQATLALYDADGKELAYDDDYRFDPDPVLFYEIPQDGEYIIEVKDAVYRGREDFVYRVTVGEFPFVTSIFPLGGRAGDAATVKLNGWNLPADELKIDAANKQPGVIPLCVHNKGLVSNTVPFALGELPESVEREPNNREGFAQTINPGIILNGRIDEPGDCDIFKFDGREGDKIVAEVYARRLMSPLDSVLTLTDATGKKLAANDDHDDKAAGL